MSKLLTWLPGPALAELHRPRTDDTPLPIQSTVTTLSARGLTHGFGTGTSRTLALNGVDLDLHAGELSLLMGPSGSGKSTLLAVLSGLMQPESGSVNSMGKELWALSDRDREQFRLAHCGYIFQGCNLFEALTAIQQLEVVLRWGKGFPQREARKKSEALLARLDLSEKLHLRPRQLSGGEKQRVAIGRALVKDPDLVFADEPTSALDWENGQQVIKLLQMAAHDRGATVLVVTHDHRLEEFADRIFEMADGKLISTRVGGRHS